MGYLLGKALHSFIGRAYLETLVCVCLSVCLVLLSVRVSLWRRNFLIVLLRLSCTHSCIFFIKMEFSKHLGPPVWKTILKPFFSYFGYNGLKLEKVFKVCCRWKSGGFGHPYNRPKLSSCQRLSLDCKIFPQDSGMHVGLIINNWMSIILSQHNSTQLNWRWSNNVIGLSSPPQSNF